MKENRKKFLKRCLALIGCCLSAIGLCIIPSFASQEYYYDDNNDTVYTNNGFNTLAYQTKTDYTDIEYLEGSYNTSIPVGVSVGRGDNTNHTSGKIQVFKNNTFYREVVSDLQNTSVMSWVFNNGEYPTDFETTNYVLRLAINGNINDYYFDYNITELYTNYLRGKFTGLLRISCETRVENNIWYFENIQLCLTPYNAFNEVSWCPFGVYYSSYSPNGIVQEQSYEKGRESMAEDMNDLQNRNTALRKQNSELQNQLDETFGWKSMFFAMADTPFKTVYNMLGFDMFGVNLFIAFTGFITVLAMLWLIKRLWK